MAPGNLVSQYYYTIGSYVIIFAVIATHNVGDTLAGFRGLRKMAVSTEVEYTRMDQVGKPIF